MVGYKNRLGPVQQAKRKEMILLVGKRRAVVCKKVGRRIGGVGAARKRYRLILPAEDDTTTSPVCGVAVVDNSSVSFILSFVFHHSFGQTYILRTMSVSYQNY